MFKCKFNGVNIHVYSKCKLSYMLAHYVQNITTYILNLSLKASTKEEGIFGVIHLIHQTMSLTLSHPPISTQGDI